MSFEISRAGFCDAEALCEMHAANLYGEWPASDFAASCGNSNRLLLKATDHGALIGFALVQFVAGEAEILSLAVAKEARRSGVGSAILSECVVVCRREFVSYIYLEVAEGNGAAQRLYQKYGVTVVARRQNYYQAGRSEPENALVMRLGTDRAYVQHT